MKIMLRLALLYGSIAMGLRAGDGAPAMDGEQVYHDNCTRCHIGIHTFSRRMMATVTHHMQVRAMLTREEQVAVLRYLLETSTSEPPKKSVSGSKGS